MKKGLVTTVIPVFNRGGMLREAVQSVLNQSWKSIEVIIVDDGSTDDTVEIANALASANGDRIKVVTQENGGVGAARQAGLMAASGEFVQFLDSDDLLLPDKFLQQVSALEADPEAGISYGKTRTNEFGRMNLTAVKRTGVQLRSVFPELLRSRLWDTSTPLYRRSALDRIGPWPNSRQLEDWQFDAQAGAVGIKLNYVDAFVSETRNHDAPRLCHAWMMDSRAMRDRITAFVHVYKHAVAGGVELECPEMQNFARSMFWMARTAAGTGFVAEAQMLFDLSRAAQRNPGWDYRLVGWCARWFGWVAAAKFSRLAERVAS
jgi:glycosyltransferase involved in cell wall biosynthesis